MKQRITSILKIFAAIVLALIVALTILLLLDFRFVSDLDSTKRSMIHTSDYDFYYFPGNFKEDEEVCGHFIGPFQPVKRYGFMYRTLSGFESKYLVYPADSDDYLGELYCFEGKDTRYYIFRLLVVGSLPPLFVENWSKASVVTINGQQYELQEHALFSTDVDFSSFFFGDYELVLRPREIEN